MKLVELYRFSYLKIHMLGKEVWCERSKVSLELQILRKLLVKATEEAEIAQAEAEAAYNAVRYIRIK